MMGGGAAEVGRGMRFEHVVFFGWRGASVLECPGGPGSLAALLRQEGLDVTAVDPLYALEPAVQLCALGGRWPDGRPRERRPSAGAAHRPQAASPSSFSMPATTTSATSWMR